MSLDLVIKQLPLKELTHEIRRTMHRSAKDAVQLGFMLRRVLEDKLYLEYYEDFSEYLECELSMDNTMASRFIGINKKYSVRGQSMEIAEEYEQYSQGLLIEMLSMTPEQEAQVSPDMTVRQVREIKKQDKVTKQVQTLVPEANTEKKEVIIEGDFREIPEAEPVEIATSQQEEIHDEKWFIEQYMQIKPKESEKLIEVCKAEKSDSDRAKALKNYIAPYGYYGCGCQEYDFTFNSFAGGINFRIGSERMHFKYGRFAKELMSIANQADIAKSQQEVATLQSEESAEEENDLIRLKRLLDKKNQELGECMKVMKVDPLPDDYIFERKTVVAALADMLCELEEMQETDTKPVQPEMPILKNNEMRKKWLAAYNDWGLWYHDEHIDVNYYKYEFEDGSRLVVAEYPQREQWFGNKKKDEYYYHLLEKGCQKSDSKKTYDKQYIHATDSETYLVEFLKGLQKEAK